MLDEDGFERLAKFDAIYLGAIGAPTVPDHISAGDLLLPLRKRVRPVRQPAADAAAVRASARRSRTARPADIDMVCVRENTEGEYSGVGGRVHRRHDVRGGRADRRLHATPASSASSATRSRSPRSGRARCWRARRSRTRFGTRWCCGMKSPRRWPRSIRRSSIRSTTSTRSPPAWSRTRRRSTSSSRRICSATS